MRIKILLKELGIKKKGAMMLLFDSISVLHIAYSPVHHEFMIHEHTKHIDINRHLIREKVVGDTT